jgi:hypothetical protein
MENIGKARYGIIHNGVFGTRIVSGIVTGIRYTEDKPVYELSFGKDKWWSDEITDNIDDIRKALKLESLDDVEKNHGLKIKYS